MIVRSDGSSAAFPGRIDSDREPASEGPTLAQRICRSETYGEMFLPCGVALGVVVGIWAWWRGEVPLPVACTAAFVTISAWNMLGVGINLSAAADSMRGRGLANSVKATPS